MAAQYEILTESCTLSDHIADRDHRILRDCDDCTKADR